MPAINLSSPYSEEFDVFLGTSGIWTDDSTIPGWFSNRTTYLTGSGTATNGSLYSFGSAAGERALGSIASGSTGTVYYGVQLVNNTTATIDALDISYFGEQWRNGGNTTAHKLDFAYQVNATSLATGTWANFDALDFTGPIATATAGALDGNANRVALSSTLSGLSLAPGQQLWLRWEDVNDVGNDHGLAIDQLDVAISGGSPVAGVTVTQTGGSTEVNEQGETTDTYTIALDTSPSGTVAIEITPDAEVEISTDGVNFFSTARTVSLGDANLSATVTVRAIDDADVEGTHTGNITHSIVSSANPAYSNSLTPIAPLSVNVLDNDVALVITPISQIQGSGAASPIANSEVTIEAIVVGDFQGAMGLNGFYIQEESADADTGTGSELTSEGLFVFAPSAINVAAGDKVRVKGTVTESFNQTQLSNITSLSIEASNQLGLVAPTVVNLPVTSTTELERYEGMLVTFPETLTVTEHFNLGRFGEVLLSSDGRLFNPTNAIDPTDSPSSETENDENNVAAVTTAQTANNLNQILLDDGSNTQNPAVVPYLHPNGVNEGTLRVGDTLEDLTGVLGFGFGSYRLQPTIAPDFIPTNPRTVAPEDVGGNVKVASFNVLNYFTTIDNGSNNARGADSAAEFERQQAKIVSAITAIDADVLGLIEIENNSAVAIGNLVDALNTEAGAGTYAVVADPANYSVVPGGDDAIKVAFIYKPGSVSLVGDAQTIDSSAFNIGRAPVAQTFSLNSNGATFTAIINHFKSKSAGGETGLDVDQNDGQGAFNATRVQQAEALLTFINSLKTSTGDDDVLVIGDLNAYGEEDPIDVLRNGGLVDELGRFETAPYSFVFQGQSGRLDHAFTTAALSAQVAGVTEWHINADEPRILDYNTEFNPPALYDDSPYRSSDHDPVVVGLNLAQPNQAPIANDDSATVIVGQSVTFSVLANDSDPDGDSISVSSFTAPAQGSVIDNGNGSFTYTAALSGNGSDRFSYTISDADGVTDTATVNLTVNRVAVVGTQRADRLNGTIASERIEGQGGSDQIVGNGGNDELLGESGNDILTGGSGNDLIDGDTGNDTITGNGGYDRLVGGSGNDRIVGGAQDDVILGGSGNDTITTGGSDGNGTATEITSRGGGDVIFTGSGSDVITLGTGKATVVLEQDSGFDTINNFQLGQTFFDISTFGITEPLSFSNNSQGVVIRSASGDQLAVVKNVSATVLSSNPGVFV